MKHLRRGRRGIYAVIVIAVCASEQVWSLGQLQPERCEDLSAAHEVSAVTNSPLPDPRDTPQRSAKTHQEFPVKLNLYEATPRLVSNAPVLPSMFPSPRSRRLDPVNRDIGSPEVSDVRGSTGPSPSPDLSPEEKTQAERLQKLRQRLFQRHFLEEKKYGPCRGVCPRVMFRRTTIKYALDDSHRDRVEPPRDNGRVGLTDISPHTLQRDVKGSFLSRKSSPHKKPHFKTRPLRIGFVYADIPEVQSQSQFELRHIEIVRRKILPLVRNWFASRFRTKQRENDEKLWIEGTFIDLPHNNVSAALRRDYRLGDRTPHTLQYGAKCGEVYLKEEHLLFRSADSTTIEQQGVGADDADVLIYWQDLGDTMGCNPLAAAIAASCRYDQEDRPIAGWMGLCDRARTCIDSNGPFDVNEVIETIIHEVIHALGFGRNDIPFFRDENGNPRTTRYLTWDVLSLPWMEQNALGTEFFEPDGTTLTYEVRGGVEHHVLVTPKLVKTVREHTGCDETTGAELENETVDGEFNLSPLANGGGSRLNHWERRVFGQDFMIADSTPISRFTPITAAFFYDSGWFKVDAEATQVPTWGHRLFTNHKCELFTGKCIDFDNYSVIQGVVKNASPVCIPNSDFTTQCDHDYRVHSQCYLATVDADALPEAFRYFGIEGDNRMKVGTVSYTDRCPVTRSLYGQYCAAVNTEPHTRNSNEVLESPTARCLHSNLLEQADPMTKNTPSPKSWSGRCYDVKCSHLNAPPPGVDQPFDKVEIFIGRDSTKKRPSVECTSSEWGNEKTLPGFAGSIFCPQVERLCWGWPCQNGGYMVKGICNCPAGIGGWDCSIMMRFTDSLIDPTFSYNMDHSTLQTGGFFRLDPVGADEWRGKLQLEATPGLPAGFSIDQSTGVVEGTARQPSPCTEYKIAAKDKTGKEISSARLRLAISDTPEPTASLSWLDACSTYRIGDERKKGGASTSNSGKRKSTPPGGG